MTQINFKDVGNLEVDGNFNALGIISGNGSLLTNIPITAFNGANFSKFVYVDAVNGLNTNNGSQFSPVQTITFAMTLAVINTIIYIAPGTYVENLFINQPNISFVCENVPYLDNEPTIVDGIITFGALAAQIGFKSIYFTNTSQVSANIILSNLINNTSFVFFQCSVAPFMTNNAIEVAGPNMQCLIVDCLITGPIISTANVT